MKRLFGKWTSLVLAAVMAFSCFFNGISALAAEETGVCLRETREELGGSVFGETRERAFFAPSSTVYDEGTLYSQLSERQKSCYDALASITVDQLAGISETSGYRYVSARVDGVYGTQLSGTIQGSNFKVGATSQKLQIQLYTDIMAAISAFRYDRADAIWASDMRYGFRWSKVREGVVQVTDCLFAFRLEYGGQEKQMWADMTAQAKAIALQAGAKADTYSRVKEAHDLLAARCVYNDAPSSAMAGDLSHTAYSALIAGDSYEPVCDGYAKAFKMVCEYLEIPCVLASSTTHMWNNVKMDDGDWYNLDLTWDDANNEAVSYTYFLVGSQTEISGEMFSKQTEHVEENPYHKAEGLGEVVFRFPTKSKTAYVYLGKDYDPLRFPDVKRSSWYYESVESAAELQLFQGSTDGLFYPGNNISRAEFAQVMANCQGVELSQPADSPFTDVPLGKWYTPAVSWAKDTGLMKGYRDGSFHPNSPITREEMCVVLANSISASPTDGFRFSDDQNISGWAKDAVYACYSAGLVEGDAQKNFSPKANTQRSQAAAVFTRYVEGGNTPPQEEQTP